ncbi:3-oxoacyl-[acyl-carrier-protein] synthase III C-terminal domain-containing protein [Streptomyces sp. NPDC059002]|uniref:3-oxoacyl-[acyl-carrier-protein] synthase III C-terminal domain-containing protein n=1 Tax=Streptomyces sp. NPDC059002 TaxID=3346690 RepID=UPI0036909D80
MKPVEPVSIAAAALWLPKGRAKLTEAVADGRLRARQAKELGHPEVPSAEVEPAPGMAVSAARETLRKAGIEAKALDLCVHAWMYYQGHDLWSPAHYVAQELGAHHAMPVGIQQVCNGGAAGVELTVARMTANAAHSTDGYRWGMVTTGDRFTNPGFDRWTSDYGVVYGDAGTAVLLRAPAAPEDALRLRSIVTMAASELESMHRGADPFAAAARTHRPRVDMRATKRAYLHEHGHDQFIRANENAIRTIVDEALRDAGMGPRDPRLRYAVLPRFGLKTLQEFWLPILADTVDAEPLDYGRSTGHLGAGDAAAGLAELIHSRALRPGEAALVFSAGAGFTWSCLVVQAPD